MADHGNGGEVEAVEGLARWQPRLQQMSLNTSLGSLGEFEFGKGCQQARRRPALTMCACRIMVELLALAHERSCEADLAAALVEQMEDGGVPDLAPLRVRFAPVAARLPVVAVNLPSIASYDVLVLVMVATACATTGAVA